MFVQEINTPLVHYCKLDFRSFDFCCTLPHVASSLQPAQVSEFATHLNRISAAFPMCMLVNASPWCFVRFSCIDCSFASNIRLFDFNFCCTWPRQLTINILTCKIFLCKASTHFCELLVQRNYGTFYLEMKDMMPADWVSPLMNHRCILKMYLKHQFLLCSFAKINRAFTPTEAVAAAKIFHFMTK